jgi:hypothetical protein
MTRWRWALLPFELFLFALILVLPQLDLPDTAFRDGNSPVMAKLQLTGAPVMSAAWRVSRRGRWITFTGPFKAPSPFGNHDARRTPFSSLHVAVLAVSPSFLLL